MFSLLIADYRLVPICQGLASNLLDSPEIVLILAEPFVAT